MKLFGNRHPTFNRLSLSTIPVSERPINVDTSKMGKIDFDGDVASIFRTEFFDYLPKQLASKDFLVLIDAILHAKENNRAVIVMLGGHVIKTGVSPYLIDLIQNKYITHVAMNGSAAIHDVEMAAFGGTSEDVEAGLEDGSFGMVEETPRIMQESLKTNAGSGIGYALGKRFENSPLPSGMYYPSILSTCYDLGVNCTVHPAFGTETLAQYPQYDPVIWAKESLRDFDQFAEHIADLHDGGVIINIGSAVMMPEVFLKALTMCRNVYRGRPKNFLSADFDMLHQYRPMTNVVNRPTKNKGIVIRGHHEIMIPLLTWGIRSYGSIRGV